LPWPQTIVCGQTMTLYPTRIRGVRSMSAPDMMTLDEISRSPRRYTPSVVLPEDPSQEELAQY
jgi:hypothetical protein